MKEQKFDQNMTIESRLNKNRIGDIGRDADLQVYEIDPLKIIDQRRFDIMAKYIYGLFIKEKIKSDFGYRLYEDHMWIFNRYDEDDGSGKKGIESFIRSFSYTLNSIESKGFDDEISLLPVGKNFALLDGAHRLSAALLYNEKIKVVKVNDSDVNYNYQFFKQKGLLTRWSDPMAYQYCKLKKNTFIVVIFPDVVKRINEVKKILNKFGQIYYEKDITFHGEGPKNLFTYLYGEDLKWINDSAYNHFKSETSIKVYVFVTNTLNDVLEAKREINSLFNSSEYTIYINTTHNDTIHLAQLFFNKNSIHFMNNSNIYENTNLKRIIKEYKNSLQDKDNDNFCVISNAVLAIYGLKELKIIEFIGKKNSELTPNNKFNSNIVDLTEQMVSCAIEIDDIIFNPENHFYFYGLKFASLSTVKKMKVKGKDQRYRQDIRLINKQYKDITKSFDYEVFQYSLRKKIYLARLIVLNLKIECMKLLSKFKSKLNINGEFFK
jgi:hypothetical protein